MRGMPVDDEVHLARALEPEPPHEIDEHRRAKRAVEDAKHEMPAIRCRRTPKFPQSPLTGPPSAAPFQLGLMQPDAFGWEDTIARLSRRYRASKRSTIGSM